MKLHNLLEEAGETEEMVKAEELEGFWGTEEDSEMEGKGEEIDNQNIEIYSLER